MFSGDKMTETRLEKFRKIYFKVMESINELLVDVYLDDNLPETPESIRTKIFLVGSYVLYHMGFNKFLEPDWGNPTTLFKERK